MTGASTKEDGSSFPKSIRHRQILDVAAENPDASIAELASMVPSATADLVETVFEEYGDPAAEDDDATDGDQPAADPSPAETQNDDTPSDQDGPTGDEPETLDDEPESVAPGDPVGSNGEDSDPTHDPTATTADDLSERQREVLAVVAAEPAATQQAIGDQLGVTAATVSNRVNSIEGFDWNDRESFVERVFDEPPTPQASVTADTTTESTTPEATDADETEATPSSPAEDEDSAATRTAALEDTIGRLEDRITALEASEDEAEQADESVFDDPDLVHRVVHACMEADTISKDEELRIIRELLE
ncbi:sigma factor-like helix-turn-helix DNA-binding protein [Haloarchaeobius amylolyticus]|uniref:sigma factor-like helix-turn-helix DNA-binding protein n=1 Tax=Haloarchaeobius amylolyticus TaxID=1198296 RepID=UPI0022701BEF|nr:sigma factor-like helix-turn-helix DNA-binding protein [Haloarchaeobius amylolyticus]